ncbi:MAG: TrmH family RNA methyltransferase [Candidatus Nomurabacteria bacterium]|nr:TrmH family RNA methyltransferase [Candidatus Nomurabacteria bacterium]
MKTPILIIDNIRSAHNVGSIFRTADAAGIQMIYLCGTTPDPTDRFGRQRNDIAKVALGAEKTIEWEHVDNTIDVVEKLKRDGCQTIAIEQSPGSVDYKKITPEKNVAFVVGNEVGGVSSDVLGAVDTVAEISMAGNKESLNVAVATGVALFRLLDK